jgi:hypothetical protein
MSCVLRNDSWRRTSSAAPLTLLAASPIEKQDESIARNTLPGAGIPGGRTGSIVLFAFGTVRSFLFSQALRTWLLSLESLPPSSRHSMRRRGGESTTADRLGQICARQLHWSPQIMGQGPGTEINYVLAALARCCPFAENVPLPPNNLADAASSHRAEP